MSADLPATARTLGRRLRQIATVVKYRWRRALRRVVTRGEVLYRPLRLTTSMREVSTVAPPRERLPAEVRVLVGAEFVVAVGYGIVAPALPEFARTFDVGVTAASAVVSGFAVFRLLFAPVSGRLLHRIGEQRMFSGGVLVVALSSVACAFASDYDQLLAFRAVGGIGSTMFTVAATSLLITLSPPHMRGRAAAASGTGFLLGTIAGPLIGGALIVVDIRAPFLIYAALLGVSALIVVVVLRGRETDELVADETVATMTFRSALRAPTFRACLASNFLNGWTVYGVRIALVPLFVVDLLGTGVWSGAALTAFALGTAATLTLGGHLADRWGRQPCAVTGSVLIAAGTAWLGFTSSSVEVLAACVVSGAGTGLLTPPENAAVADVLAPKGGVVRSGSALAGFQMCGDVGAILGPVLAGLAVDLGGYAAAFVLTAALAVGAAWGWRHAPDVGRQDENAEATSRSGVVGPTFEVVAVACDQTAGLGAPPVMASASSAREHVAAVACGYSVVSNAVQSSGEQSSTESVTALDMKR